MRVNSLFTDHMVLQQGTPIRIWGWASPQEAITVNIAGQVGQAITDENGAWNVVLNPLSAGGPFDLTICGDETLVLHDVMVGEVWVCSGQSNMEMGIEFAQDAECEIAAANYPNIRLFTVPKMISEEPQEDASSSWLVCTPENVIKGDWGGFSATAYYFGRELANELNVPIGLIHPSWGGTVAEAWTSREALLANDELSGIVSELDDHLAHYEENSMIYHTQLRAWEEEFHTWETENLPKDPGNTGVQHGWADPANDTSGWPEITLPCTWQSVGLPFSGSLWFRKTVIVPDDWQGHDLVLHTGSCDKDDTTYFNGEQVGRLTHDENPNSWCTPRAYTVPGRLVKRGANVIAVRVFSHVYDGGMRGPAHEMFLEAPTAGETIPLQGNWQYTVEHNLGLIKVPTNPPTPPIGEENPNSPTMLFNGMIAPLTKFAIRGAIWYQGESNAERPEQYRTLFPVMIRDWRNQWSQGDFPFFFVQLANYIVSDEDAAKGRWAELREAQTMALDEPNTGMAVIADIGTPNDIHPTNKQEVGRRLALNALANVYGKANLVYSGPMFRTANVEGSYIRISFDHIGSGLIAKDNTLDGFLIAGDDGIFVPADAQIDGETVIVSNPKIPSPVAVRYAWEDNPTPTLFNAEGLPASPFRTDCPAIVPVH